MSLISKIRKRKEEQKGVERKRAPSNRPEWFVYMLVLMTGPHAGKMYVGKTYNPEMRLRQHNNPKSKTVRTSRWTDKHKHQWELVWVVSGFKLEEHALKFEWRCQKLKMHNFKNEPTLTPAYKYLLTPPTKRYQRHIKYLTRNMLITCCLTRWSTTLKPARELTDCLTITWYKSNFAPKNESGEWTDFKVETCHYLPCNEFVSQVFLTPQQVIERMEKDKQRKPRFKIPILSREELRPIYLRKLAKLQFLDHEDEIIDLTK